MLRNIQSQLRRSQLTNFVASNAAARTLSTIPPTDFCVVGGGIIGVTVAAELREQHPDSRITVRSFRRNVIMILSQVIAVGERKRGF